jgi:hypothetical protein
VVEHERYRYEVHRAYDVNRAYQLMSRAYASRGMAIAYRAAGKLQEAERYEREAADFKAQALEDAAALGIEISI